MEHDTAGCVPEIGSADFRSRTGINQNFLSTTIGQLYGHVSGMNGTYFHSQNEGDVSVNTDPLRYPHAEELC